MYQKLQIIGHVGRDPEMRYTPAGQAVTNFSVATNRKWTGNDGQTKDETTWFKVTAWGKQAEICNQYVTKGMLILCEGRLSSQINIWTDQSGTPRAGYDMTAEEIKFLGGRGSENQQVEGGQAQPAAYNNAPRPAQPAYNNQPTAPRPAAPPAPMPAPPAYHDEGINEDEIPF